MASFNPPLSYTDSYFQYLVYQQQVCPTCLSNKHGFRLIPLEDSIRNLLEILGFQVFSTDRVCSECFDLLQKVLRFQETAKEAYSQLVCTDWIKTEVSRSLSGLKRLNPKAILEIPPKKSPIEIKENILVRPPDETPTTPTFPRDTEREPDPIYPNEIERDVEDESDATSPRETDMELPVSVEPNTLVPRETVIQNHINSTPEPVQLRESVIKSTWSSLDLQPKRSDNQNESTSGTQSAPIAPKQPANASELGNNNNNSMKPVKSRKTQYFIRMQNHIMSITMKVIPIIPQTLVNSTEHVQLPDLNAPTESVAETQADIVENQTLDETPPNNTVVYIGHDGTETTPEAVDCDNLNLTQTKLMLSNVGPDEDWNDAYDTTLEIIENCDENSVEQQIELDMNNGKSTDDGPLNAGSQELVKLCMYTDIARENVVAQPETLDDDNNTDQDAATIQDSEGSPEIEESSGESEKEIKKLCMNTGTSIKTTETLSKWQSVVNSTGNNLQILQCFNKLPEVLALIEDNKEKFVKQPIHTKTTTENIRILSEGHCDDNNAAEELPNIANSLEKNKNKKEVLNQTTRIEFNPTKKIYIPLEMHCNVIGADDNLAVQHRLEEPKSQKVQSIEENNEDIEKQISDTDTAIKNIDAPLEMHGDENITDNNSVALQSGQEILEHISIDENKEEIENPRVEYLPATHNDDSDNDNDVPRPAVITFHGLEESSNFHESIFKNKDATGSYTEAYYYTDMETTQLDFVDQIEVQQTVEIETQAGGYSDAITNKIKEDARNSWNYDEPDRRFLTHSCEFGAECPLLKYNANKANDFKKRQEENGNIVMMDDLNVDRSVERQNARFRESIRILKDVHNDMKKYNSDPKEVITDTESVLCAKIDKILFNYQRMVGTPQILTPPPQAPKTSPWTPTAAPQDPTATPQASTFTPRGPTDTPQASTAAPQIPTATHQARPAKRRTPTATRQTSTATRQAKKSTARAPAATLQASTATPRAPTATPRAPTATPRAPTATPQAPTATPQAPTATLQAPTATPQAPTATPQDPTATPQASTFTPQASTVTPKASTVTPQALTATAQAPTATLQAPTSTPPAPTGTPQALTAITSTATPWAAPTATLQAPTATPWAAPTATLQAPTATPQAPTATPCAPTATPWAPTVTPQAPTATPRAPTATLQAATATRQAKKATAPVRTATPCAPTATPWAPTVTPQAPTATPRAPTATLQAATATRQAKKATAPVRTATPRAPTATLQASTTTRQATKATPRAQTSTPQAPTATPWAAPTTAPHDPTATPWAAPTTASHDPTATPWAAPTTAPQDPTATPWAAPTTAPHDPTATPWAAPTTAPQDPTATPWAAPTTALQDPTATPWAAPTATPRASTVTPQASTVTPQVSTATPRASTATPWAAPTATPQASTFTPQASTVTPKASTVTPQASTATPRAPTATPCAPTATPWAPTVTPQAPTATPRAPTATLQAATATRQAKKATAPVRTATPRAPTATLQASTTTRQATKATPRAQTSTPQAPTATPWAAPTTAPHDPTATPWAAPTTAPHDPTATPWAAPTTAPQDPTATPWAAPTTAPHDPTATPWAAPTTAPQDPTATPWAAPTTALQDPTATPWAAPTATPRASTVTPQASTVTPQVSTATPRASTATPWAAPTATPRAPTATPQASTVTPQVSTATPRSPTATSRAAPTATPQDPTATPQASTFTPQASTVTPKASTVTPQASTATPRAPTATPRAAPTATPRAPTATPQASTVTPQVSTATPRAPTATPRAAPTATPQASTATPQAPTAKLWAPTATPQASTATRQATKATPRAQTATPQAPIATPWAAPTATPQAPIATPWAAPTATPQAPIAIPQAPKTKLLAPTATPQASTATRQATKPTPRAPTATPRAPTATPRAPTATPQAPTATPQASTATPQNSTATPRAPTATPQASTATPQAPTTTPQASTFTPRAPTDTPQASTATPQAPTAAPQASTFTPRTPTDTPWASPTATTSTATPRAPTANKIIQDIKKKIKKNTNTDTPIEYQEKKKLLQTILEAEKVKIAKRKLRMKLERPITDKKLLSLKRAKFNEQPETSCDITHTTCKKNATDAVQSELLDHDYSQNVRSKYKEIVETTTKELKEIGNDTAGEAVIEHSVKKRVVESSPLESTVTDCSDARELEDMAAPTGNNRKKGNAREYKRNGNASTSSHPPIEDDDVEILNNTDIDVEREDFKDLQDNGGGKAISVFVKVEPCDAELDAENEINKNDDWTVETYRRKRFLNALSLIERKPPTATNASETTYISDLDTFKDRNLTTRESVTFNSTNENFLDKPLEYHYEGSPSENAEYIYDSTKEDPSRSLGKIETDNLTVCFENPLFDFGPEKMTIVAADECIDNAKVTNANMTNDFEEIRNTSPGLLEPLYYTHYEDQMYDHDTQHNNKTSGKSIGKKEHLTKDFEKAVTVANDLDNVEGPLLDKKRGRKRKHEEFVKKVTEEKISSPLENKDSTLDGSEAGGKRNKRQSDNKKQPLVNKNSPPGTEKLSIENGKLVPGENKKDQPDNKKTRPKSQKLQSNNEKSPNNEERTPDDEDEESRGVMNNEQLLQRPVVYLERLKEAPRSLKKLKSPITRGQSEDVMEDPENVTIFPHFQDESDEASDGNEMVEATCYTYISSSGNINAETTYDIIDIDSPSVTKDESGATESSESDESIKSDKKKGRRVPSKEMQTEMSRSKMYSVRELRTGEIEQLRENRKSDKRFIKAKFKCVLCVRDFSSKYVLRGHNQRFHQESSGPLTCKVCECRFVNNSQLKTHVKSHKSCLQCGLCASEHLNFNNLTDHFKSKHCRTYYKVQKQLRLKRRGLPKSFKCRRRHETQVHEGKRFTCEFCRNEYSSHQTLIQHSKNVKNGLPCQSRSKEPDRSLENNTSFSGSNGNCLTAKNGSLTTNSGSLTCNNASLTKNNSYNNVTLSDNNRSVVEYSPSSNGDKLSFDENSSILWDGILTFSESCLSITDTNVSLWDNILSLIKNKPSLTETRNRCVHCDQDFGTIYAYRRHVVEEHSMV